MKRIVFLTLFSALCLSACEEDKPKEKVDVEEPKPEKTEPKEPEITEADLPELAPDEPKTQIEANVVTPVDYEEEAEESIAVENLEAELDRLEAEIVDE